MRKRHGMTQRTRRGLRRASGGILAAALLISLGFPGLYYAYGLHMLLDVTSRYARQLAQQMAAVLPDASQPWRTPLPEIRRRPHDFLDPLHREVTRVQVLDDTGRPVPVSEAAAPGRRRRASLPPLVVSAPIRLKQQLVGRVQVEVSQADLLREAFAFFVVCALTGISLVVGTAPQGRLRRRGADRMRRALRAAAIPASAGGPGSPRLPAPAGRDPESG